MTYLHHVRQQVTKFLIVGSAGYAAYQLGLYFNPGGHPGFPVETIVAAVVMYIFGGAYFEYHFQK